MLWLCENIAPIAVAASASVVAWMHGGARGDVLVPVVPWVFALLLEVFLVFPQRHHGESSVDARSRNWRRLGRSAVVWTAIGLFLLLLIPFVNEGLCPKCDAALIAQGLNPAPRMTFLPFCVDRMDHLSVVLGMAMMLELAVVVFFGLTHDGKRLALEMIVWNGVAMAAFGFIQVAFDAPGPFWDMPPNGPALGHGAFFSVFGYPNMAGDYFTLLFGLSFALWRHHCEAVRLADAQEEPDTLSTGPRQLERFLRRHYLLIPTVILFFSALYTLSRAAIILATSTAFVYFLHTMMVVLFRMKKSRRIFIGVWSSLAFLLVAFFAMIFMPKDMRREVDTIDSLSVLDRVTGRGQYHTTVATEIWRDHPVFGCGGWGYKHFCVPKMTALGMDVKRELQKTGGANVHNDYLQFLAEHGLVGFGAMALLAILLYAPVVRQWAGLVRDARFEKSAAKKTPKPLEIFALPAPAFIVSVAVLATLIHAFGDCPLRSGAVLSLVYVSIAAIGGFMPNHKH